MKLTQFLLAVALLLPATSSEAEAANTEIVVQGAVKAPGRYTITGATALSDIISQAGGVQNFWGRKIRIVRRESDILTHIFEYDLGRLKADEKEKVLRELMVQPGDIILVPEIVC